MGNERVEGYAEGFRIGWNRCRERVLKLIADAPDVKYLSRWLEEEIEKDDSEFIYKKMIGCGKTFETDLTHHDGYTDILVCICGGEDGLCQTCDKQEASKNV